MTFTLDAVAEPLNDPPRVVLTATEDDPDLSLQTAEFFRDGVPLRFDAAITGDLAIAYDYDADFDVELTYRIEATELGEVDDWAETWASLAAWTGSGWAAGSGVASSTTPASVIYRDTAGTIIKVMVTSPSNMTLQLTDVDDNVVVSAKVSADGTVTLSGVTASKVTGSGSYTLTLSDTSATITGTGWETSVAISGVPTTVQLVAPPAATLLASYGTDLQIGLAGKVMGIAFNAAGTFFFVTDVARKKILKFDATTGAFVSEFGTPGSGSGQLSEPAGLDLDASDNVWVVDAARNRVLKYNSSGVFQAEYGASGTGNGQFDGPGDIAFKSTGNFVVTDFGNDRIQEFNSAGTYVSKFTVASEPLRVCIGASDDIIVTLWTPDEVRRYNAAGTLQDTFDVPPSGALVGPNFVDRDSSGNFYVTDYYNDRIVKYTSAGAYVTEFGNGNLYGPEGIKVLSSGDVFVVDGIRPTGYIQKYSQAVGSVDDITTRISVDESREIEATDTATLSPTGDQAGAWLGNTALPDLAILAEAEPGSNDDPYFIPIPGTRESRSMAANSIELPIEGSADVMTAALGPRRNARWTLVVACRTEAAAQALELLLANSAPISLRLPATPRWEGLRSGFYAVGDVDGERMGHPQYGPIIVYPLPLTPSRAPKFKPILQWSMDALDQTGLSIDDVNVVFPTIDALVLGPV
jgi:sugar lactone lactonase YvrE